MRAAEDFTGRQIGRLSVLSRVFGKIRHDGKPSVIWQCRCSCGTVKEFTSRALREDSISCGCYRTENNKKMSKARKLPNDLSAKRHVFSYYRRNAERRGIEFSLNFEFFIEMVQQKCRYCGDSKVNLSKKYSSIWAYTGIDRVDNSKGYVENNCVPCCVRCNMAKGSRSLTEFTDWAKRLYGNIFHK